MMKRLTLFIILFSLFLSTGICPAQGQGNLLVKNGFIYTITGPKLYHSDILVSGGRIKKIGQNLQPPKGTKILDLKGQVVMPGLVLAEESQVLGWGSPPEGINVYSNSMRFVLSAGITAVYSNGYVMKPTYKDPSGIVLSKHQVFRLTRTSWLNRYTFRQNLLKAREFLRMASLYDAAKQEGKKITSPPPKPSGSIQTYIKIITGQLQVHARLTRVQDILHATSIAREFNINLVLEDATEGWTVASEIGRAGASIVFSLRREEEPPSDPDDAPGSNVRAAAIYRKAGVPFALVPPASGLNITGGPAGRGVTSLMMEAAFAVRGGLDEETALAAITIEPAKILGVANRIGSIEIGKDADFIVLDGDPLHWKTFVTLTIINGKVYYDRTKDNLLPK